MLMFDHRWNIDQISLLPVPALAVVNIISTAIDDEDLLFGHVTVRSRTAPRRDFLKVQPNPPGRTINVRMGVPFQAPLAGPFPGLFFEANHMGDRLAEFDFFAKQPEIPIVGISNGPAPFFRFQAGAEYPFDIRGRTQVNVDVLRDA